MKKNPFETLGLEPRLLIERQELNQAFRDLGKTTHPDAGGSEEDFASLQSAVEILQSPARRLKVWLEIKGIEVESRGAISNELMDEFGRVGQVTQRAEALLRKREAAQSALARAMLESETQVCREELELTISRLGLMIDGVHGRFEQLENGAEDLSAGVQWHRDLTFLEKWQAGLRALFARLL